MFSRLLSRRRLFPQRLHPGEPDEPGFHPAYPQLPHPQLHHGTLHGRGPVSSLIGAMQKTLDENPVGAHPVIWSDLLRNLAFADSLRRSLILSMAISVLSILALTIFVFRSPLFGLYPMVPLIAGLLLNFALMALTRIPLDMTTIMVSNIAIGVGVDGPSTSSSSIGASFGAAPARSRRGPSGRPSSSSGSPCFSPVSPSSRAARICHGGVPSHRLFRYAGAVHASGDHPGDARHPADIAGDGHAARRSRERRP